MEPKGQANYFLKICDIEGKKIVDDANFQIYGVSDPLNPISNTIIFVKKDFNLDIDVQESIIVTKKHLDIDKSNRQIVSLDPKNDYADILNKLQREFPAYKQCEKNSSIISENAQIGDNTRIGRFCVIEDDVIIGEGCSISDYSYIGSHTRIGNKVSIQEKCMIGVSDADIYREEDCCLTLPHLAGTIIEDGCLCLSGAHVAAGDTRPTVIKSGSMVGLGANIGHNCLIGNNVLIGAHACVCGHCTIGDNSYIAPSATIINRLNVGANAHIGIGSVVLQNVEDGMRVFGNPAMPTMPLNLPERPAMKSQA